MYFYIDFTIDRSHGIYRKSVLAETDVVNHVEIIVEIPAYRQSCGPTNTRIRVEITGVECKLVRPDADADAV